MNNTARIILITLAFSALGLCGALGIHSALLQLITDGAFTRWQGLGSTPEKIVRLIGIGQYGADHAVYVETRSGQIYRCCTSSRAQWENIELPPYVYAQDCGSLPRQAPQPPSPMIACTEVAAFEYVVERTQYALLEDGTVWKWYYHVGIDTTVLILGAGLIIGSITGVFVAWVIARRT